MKPDAPERSVLLAAILAIPFLATPGSADARSEKGKAAPVPAEVAAEEVAAEEFAAQEVAAEDAAPDDEGELAEAPGDPLMEAFRASLDPEARATFDSVGEDGLQELFDRAGRGEALSPAEEHLLEAIQRQTSDAFDAELNYQTGDVALGDGLATLHLGESFRYLDPEQTDRILVDMWGNPPGPRTLGMIVPADLSPVDVNEGWGVVITYTEEGHVEDDDAEDIDYDELLEEMKKDTEAENASRTAQGYPALHLMGWAEPPRYQAADHRLYWAQELSFEDTPETTLNYAIRVLGRKGVLELNAVAGMRQLQVVKPVMEDVLSRVEFDAGNRYTDFDPDLDDVAAYGIGGLIAGKVLAKAGFFAVILKFLVAAKKLLIVGAIALGAGIKAFFSRKKSTDVDGEV